jgi:hypothetical protein
VALAAVLLAHSPAFRRSDEILYLVEKAADFTLTASGRFVGSDPDLPATNVCNWAV